MISENEYAAYYAQYIAPYANNEKSIVENLEESQQKFDAILRNIPIEKQNFAYVEGKWTVKEVIQHIIDTERIFCYRALSFARNDKTQLPGFDQDLFVENDFANQRDYSLMLNEMTSLRISTMQLFLSFTDDALLRIGNASGNNMSVRAIGYLLSGHQMHHLQVLQERYL